MGVEVSWRYYYYMPGLRPRYQDISSLRVLRFFTAVESVPYHREVESSYMVSFHLWSSCIQGSKKGDPFCNNDDSKTLHLQPVFTSLVT
jgi:hypothetical protein